MREVLEGKVAPEDFPRELVAPPWLRRLRPGGLTLPRSGSETTENTRGARRSGTGGRHGRKVARLRRVRTGRRASSDPVGAPLWP